MTTLFFSGRDSVPDLARRLPRGRTTDADDVTAALEAGGGTDRGAAQRYGVPSLFALGEVVLDHLRRLRWARAGVRPVPATVPYLGTALARAALYLVPVLLAAAAPLDRVGWPVAAGILLLGWPAAQALTGAGQRAAEGMARNRAPAAATGPGRLAGMHSQAEPTADGGHASDGAPRPAAEPRGSSPGVPGGARVAGPGWRADLPGRVRGVRVVAAGFAGVALIAAGLLAAAPDRLIGADPRLAWCVAGAGLAVIAALAAAVVAGTERAMLAAFAPACAIAVASVTGLWERHLLVPAGPVLLAATLAAAGWTFRPALHVRTRPSPDVDRAALAVAGGRAWVGQAVAHALIGLGQAAAFVLIWRAAPGGGGLAPAAIPILVALPLLEIFTGWHAARVSGALDGYDSVPAYRRHLRAIAVVAVAGLLPPLVVGTVAGVAAYRMPYGLSHHAGVRTLVLGLAAGLLLAGVYAVILLLAGRGRLGTAVVVALAPIVATGAAALPGTPLSTVSAAGLLPTAVAVLIGVYVCGLTAAGTDMFDHRARG